MPQIVTPENILELYKKAIKDHLSIHKKLTVDAVIDISLALFDSIKIKDVDYSEPDHDMLLFQYGTYDWGDKKKLHTSFDITRQFPIPDEDEFYQLSFSLNFDPTILEKKEAHTSWSSDFESIEEWVAKIKSTTGYQKLQLVDCKSHELHLDQT